MCYMRAAPKQADVLVGVRELRQNLSVYLERVPLPPAATAAERLIASGRAAPATVDLLSLGRPTIRAKQSVSDALREIRADRL